MLNLARIQAITLDLDDTLWPVWPTIHRAEEALQLWLRQHAPGTALAFATPAQRHAVRTAVVEQNPERAHDLSWLRRESIRHALRQVGEDTALAEPAFEVFFAARQQVDLFADALPALQALSRRFPVVALSNGNADVHRVGLGAYFRASVSARDAGVAKPHRAIFAAGAAAVDVAPEAVLHVGDDAHLDVVGALDAGMQTAWVNREGKAWEHPGHRPHSEVTDLAALCRLLGL